MAESWATTKRRVIESSVLHPLTLRDVLTEVDQSRYPASLDVPIYFSEGHGYRGTTKIATPEQAKSQGIPERYIILGKNFDYETLRHEAQHLERAARGRPMDIHAEVAAYKQDIALGRPVPRDVAKLAGRPRHISKARSSRAGTVRKGR